MNFFLKLSVLLACLRCYVWGMWPREWIVGNTCQQAASINFDECNSQAGQCLCSNANFAATVAQCLESSLETTPEIDSAWDFVFVKNCRQTEEQADALYKATKAYLNETKLTFLDESFNRTDIFHGPLVFPHDNLKGIYRSVWLNLENRDISVWQGAALVMIFVVAAGFATVSNFLTYVAFKFASKRQVMGRPTAFTRFLQKHVLIPACFGTNHINRIYFLGVPVFIPTRMESFIIFTYGICAFAFLCGTYKTMPMNPLWSTSYSVAVLNLSNRAGIIATMQIPLLTLFALRNNFLIWLTGWSFSKFNAYHRSISRITFLLLCVHAVGKCLMMMTFHVPLAKILYPEFLYRLGVTGLGLMALMIMVSMVRTKLYEMFLAVHVVGAFAAYLTALYHLNGLGYKQSIYVSLGIWAVDILIRIGRIAFVNMSIFLDPVSGSSRMTQAQVSLLESDVINVKVKTPINWNMGPGQYVFIHFSKFSLLQSHPFSVVGPSDDGESFQLMCKARGGITKRVHKALSSDSMRGPQLMPVLIEGPYGVHCPVQRYDTVLLVAGGIGITGIIPYAEHLVNDVTKQQHIILIWTVGNLEEFTWVQDRLLKLNKTGKIDLCLYTTKNSKVLENTDYAMAFENKEPQVTYSEVLHRTPTKDSSHKQELKFDKDWEGRGNSMDIDNAMGASKYHTTKPVERKSALFKHVKSLSQGSLRFHVHVDPAHRSENVDGHEMVDWPDATNDYRRSHYKRRSDESYSSRLHVRPYHESHQYKEMASSTVVPVQDLQTHAFADFVQQGRPNIHDMVLELFRRATGSVAVVGCGPAMMMDTLRQAVVSNLDYVAHGRTDYFEEAFSW